MELELLVMMQHTVNRSLSQTKELYVLCDSDFEKLLKVEACLKRTGLRYCPGDKEEVEKLIILWDELREKDKQK